MVGIVGDQQLMISCEGCGAEVPRGRANPRKWCSGTCRVRAYLARHPEYAQRQKEARARAYRENYEPPRYERTCPACGNEFIAGRRDQQFCSKSCTTRASHLRTRNEAGRRASRAAVNRERHALKRGAALGERFSDVEVYERDGWQCGLCDEPINSRLRHPHPLSASIDHVMPLALGGAHSMENVQAAHLVCNARKGVRLVQSDLTRSA